MRAAAKRAAHAMSNCAVGLEASCHVLFILAFAGFVAFDWYHRDNEDRPQPARDDWATVLARFVCRRPLGLAALVTAYAGYISLAAFVDVDCGQARSLHLVTALEQYARQDELSSFSLDNWESAQEASLNLGLCSAQRRLGAEPHRSLAAVGVTESLKIIYAARPRPGNVITAKSLLDARTTELRVTSNEYFDDHCYIAGGPDGKDRRCSNAAMRSWTESYFQSNGNVVDDVDAAALEFAKTPEGRYFFDVYFNVLHPQSNVSVSEIFFSITDRDMFRKWAKEYVLPTLESASTKDTRVCWLNGDLNDIEVEEAVTHDSLLAIGSLIFVALCMVIHTRSPSVAAVAMAQVLASVPIGVYLHRVIFGIEQFYVLNSAQIKSRGASCLRLTPARWRGGVGLLRLDSASAPDSIVDLHTGVELPRSVHHRGNRCGRQLFTLRRVEGRSGPRTVENITRDPDGIVPRGGRVHGRHVY